MPRGRTGENTDHDIEPQEFYGFELNLTPQMDAEPGMLKARVSDLNSFEARITGRSHDLEGAHDESAQAFTEIFKWPINENVIKDASDWMDAARAVYICAALTEELADAVEHYKDERSRIINRWNREAPKDDHSGVPLDPGDYSDPGAEYRQSSFFNVVRELKDELEEEEFNLKKATHEIVDEITDDLKDWENPDVLSRLYHGGYVNHGYFNLGGEIESGIPLDVNREELPEDLMEYVDGDKEPDDDFYEMIAVLSNLGFRAANAQHHEDAEMYPADMELLKDLFDHIEEESDLFGIPENVEENLSAEDSAALLGALGGGIIALSDKRLTGGDENVPGGYYDLPQSVREAAEGTHLVPADEPTPSGRSWAEDMSALADFFEHSESDLEAGYGLSATLALTSGMYAHEHGPPLEDLMPEEDILTIVDLAGRNKDAMHDIFAGVEGEDGEREVYTHPNMQRGEYAYTPNEVIEMSIQGLFTSDWSDDGDVVSSIFDWIADDAENGSAAEQERAGSAAAGFVDLITRESMYEELSSAHGMPGDRFTSGSVFTNYNGAIAQGLAPLFDAYIDSFAASEVQENLGNGEYFSGVGPYDSEMEGFAVGVHERLNFMHYLMGDNKSAGELASSVATYDHLATRFYMETGDRVFAQRSGTLYGIFEKAVDLEARQRMSEEEEGNTVYEKLIGLGVNEIGNIAQKTPIIGNGLSHLLGEGADEIIDRVVEDVALNPRVDNTSGPEDLKREYELRLIEHAHNSDSSSVVNNPSISAIENLVDLGVMEQDKEGNVSLDLDSSSWDVENGLGGGEEEVQSAIDEALRAAVFNPPGSSDGGDNGVNYSDQFWTPYNNRREEMKDSLTPVIRDRTSIF